MLKPAAFKSVPGTDDVSVMRHTYMGTNACRQKARSLVEGNAKVTYAGLAVITASEIRACGSDVQDSRQEFCGHAHISHGIILTRDEPEDSEKTVALNERIRDLIKKCQYYPDPSVEMDTWMATDGRGSHQ